MKKVPDCYAIAWPCLCLDITLAAGELSTECPGHGCAALTPPSPVWRTGPMRYGHGCGWELCPTTTPPRTACQEHDDRTETK